MGACPYPVLKNAGGCCGHSPCDVQWHRPCEELGGCWDRSTCGDCAEPVYPQSAQGALRNIMKDALDTARRLLKGTV